MNKVILKIYDLFQKKPYLAWCLFFVITAMMVCSVLTLTYNEDISDFLPLDEKNQTALSVYQDISGANKIYAIISAKDTTNEDPQKLVDGVELFASKLESTDTLHYIKNVIKEIDMEKMGAISDTIFANIPYFLNDEDYCRIDSLLSSPGYISRQIEEDRQLLLFPSSNILTTNISRDPLNLFTPILGRLRQAGVSINFDTYDGYIVTPDSKRAIVIMKSSFGAQETENNASLVKLLNDVKRESEIESGEIDIHIIGGPVIAVSNANCIKNDSILAGSLAGILIILLLIYVFRNLRNILLIIVSTSWGWLFAMAAISAYYHSVSIIVIGIASVILGIAVNYPLHLIDHLRESSNPRTALKEIISPLVVGNVTTVGAFLCLVPLNSPALHDLGVFSSLLLIGTITFVLIFLPHIVKTKGKGYTAEPRVISKLANISLENNKMVVWAVLLMTLIFGYFSQRTEFDSDMRHINYMTDDQKEDMAYFQSLVKSDVNTESVYVVSSGETWEEALRKNHAIDFTIDSLVFMQLATRQTEASSFLVSKEEQAKRLERWNDFIARYQHELTSELNEASARQGFNKSAFEEFNDIVNRKYEVVDFDYFKGLISTVFQGNISEDKTSGRKALIQELVVPTDSINRVKEELARCREFDGFVFDVRSMNSSIADTLSNDFNYIGIACGFIVFVFLWISLGRIELAIVSFIPMAFSWVWILGIMGLLGIKFNIVNIILATFIFGQGDDYTIFITEGLCYEYTYRKKLLASYKNSIIVSALIMFIGIGTLLIAKHPALRSLGEVTVVGMVSVVIMAYLFPPLIFKWMTQADGKLRFSPMTLKRLSQRVFAALIISSQAMGIYAASLLIRISSAHKLNQMLRQYLSLMLRYNLERMPGFKVNYDEDNEKCFADPMMVSFNLQSGVDVLIMLSLSPKIVVIIPKTGKYGCCLQTIFSWSGQIIYADNVDDIESTVIQLLKDGHSVAIPTNGDSISSTLETDLIPVFIARVSPLQPEGDTFVEIGNLTNGDFTELYSSRLYAMHTKIATVERIIPIVYDKYIYKGKETAKIAKRVLNECLKCENLIQSHLNAQQFIVRDYAGQGELALLLALIYPQSRIYCYFESQESKSILQACLKDFVQNITIIDELEIVPKLMSSTLVYEVTDNPIKILLQESNI